MQAQVSARLPRGIPAASLKLTPGRRYLAPCQASSAGNTRGLIEASACGRIPYPRLTSSAGNTRGLIEAIQAPETPKKSTRQDPGSVTVISSLPRGIPAASLKPFYRTTGRAVCRASSAGNTRGLIEACSSPAADPEHRQSSAGNTRGLIEACTSSASLKAVPPVSAGNTRGLIEAWYPAAVRSNGTSLPRGIPAASLKHL